MTNLVENVPAAALSHVTDIDCAGYACAKPKCIKISIDDKPRAIGYSGLYNAEGVYVDVSANGSLQYGAFTNGASKMTYMNIAGGNIPDSFC